MFECGGRLVAFLPSVVAIIVDSRIGGRVHFIFCDNLLILCSTRLAQSCLAIIA